MGRGKRLDQVLAHLGLGSRKEVRRLIREGLAGWGRRWSRTLAIF